MPQHSHKWPVCPECRYRGSVVPCADCRDGAGASPIPTRAAIDATVLRLVGRYLGRPVTLDQTMAESGLSQLDAMQAMLDLEDEYEAQGLVLLGRVTWYSLRDLADQVALGVLPGESGEVVDHAACADGLRPRKGEVVYGEIIHPPARIKD